MSDFYRLRGLNPFSSRRLIRSIELQLYAKHVVIISFVLRELKSCFSTLRKKKVWTPKNCPLPPIHSPRSFLPFASTKSHPLAVFLRYTLGSRKISRNLPPVQHRANLHFSRLPPTHRNQRLTPNQHHTASRGYALHHPSSAILSRSEHLPCIKLHRSFVLDSPTIFQPSHH